MFRAIPIIMLLQLLLGMRVLLPALHGLYHQASELHHCSETPDLSAICTISNSVEIQQKSTKAVAQATVSPVYDFMQPQAVSVPELLTAESSPEVSMLYQQEVPLLDIAIPTPPPQV